MRLPDGMLAQPWFAPASSSYSFDDAQETNFQAASYLVLFFSIAHDQAYSQPDALVFLTGACT